MCIRDRYKRMLNGLTGLSGPPMNLPDWIEKESLPAERVLYMHCLLYTSGPSS